MICCIMKIKDETQKIALFILLQSVKSLVDTYNNVAKDLCMDV